MPSSEFVLAFESFGLAAAVLTDDRDLFQRLPEALPPGWRPARDEPVSPRFGLMRDGAATLDGTPLAWAGGNGRTSLEGLARAIRHHLAEHAPGHVFIHAGVVAAGDVGIVIPGASLSGKTTLVVELVRAGATYYSDEYAVVDPGGLIHPYPQPVSMRYDPYTGAVLAPVPVPDDQIGRRPLRAGLIVITRHRNRGRWRPDRADSAQGALALVEHSVAARVQPARVLSAARQLAQGATVLVGDRGDARAIVPALLELARAKTPDGAARRENEPRSRHSSPRS